MPLYEVAHTTPLTDSQKDDLAAAITDIHSSKFTVPRMFINVIFMDTSNVPTYVAGKRKTNTNRILARVRRGPSRTQQDFNALCSEVRAAWARVVHPGYTSGQIPPVDLELRTVFITGEIIAGMKTEFYVPTAGNELSWAKENYAAFKQRADQGDEDFIDLVAEVEQWPGFSA